LPRIVVFAPSRPGEESLAQSRWIAARNIDALKRAGHQVAAIVDEDADRAGLEGALTPPEPEIHGMALFAHGQDATIGTPRQLGRAMLDDAILGRDGQPALDRKNIRLARERWVHALACRSAGTELPRLALERGRALLRGL
jgi:hypothetical protein